jgi:hypothetical protein
VALPADTSAEYELSRMQSWNWDCQVLNTRNLYVYDRKVQTICGQAVQPCSNWNFKSCWKKKRQIIDFITETEVHTTCALLNVLKCTQQLGQYVHDKKVQSSGQSVQTCSNRNLENWWKQRKTS